jgi:hypothetical protein
MRSLILASILAALGLLVSLTGFATESPYVGFETRSIKSLSPEQIEQYRQGHGMGLALAAELNGYPGPKHVLELAEALDLTAEQKKSAEEIFEHMRLEAIALGERIIVLESELNSLFEQGSIDNEVLRDRVSQLSVLQGDLRTVHLAAHLEIQDLLSDEQVKAYNDLRGYADQAGGEHRHHSGHQDG